LRTLKGWSYGPTRKGLSRAERNAGGGEYSEVEDELRQVGSRYPYPRCRGGQTVGDFWAWAYSNILTNITRGLFAEFLVGTALGAVEGTRTEWDSFDLLYKDAKI
jgi:hypothetical protein